MQYLTKALIGLGLTRDSPLWARLQITTIAMLIVTGVVDISYWAAYLGIPLGPIGLHWIRAIAIAVLFFAGKYDTSGLPSTAGKIGGTK
jgi:hypothetical protein